MDQLKANGGIVATVTDGLSSGTFSSLPGLIGKMLADGAWREYKTLRGEVVRHERFEEFVTTPPTHGLGATMDLVKRVVAADPVVYGALEDTLADSSRPGARTDLVDNINEVSRPDGTSRAQALRALRKHNPELHARVINGELSPNAAMIEAGLRPKTATFRPGDPASTARTLLRHMSTAHIAELRELLSPKG
jgi:hypothetical protein